MGNKIIYGILFAIISVLSLLSFRWLQKLGEGFARCVKLTKSRKVIRVNLKHCSFDQDHDLEKLVNKTYRHMAMTGFEMMSVFRRSPSYLLSQIVEVEGEGAYQQALARGNGVMVLSSHIGCWEIGAMYFSSSTETAMLYTPAKKPYIDRLLVNARSKLCKKMSPASASGVKMLLQTIRAKKTIALLTDQVPTGVGHIYLPFFSKMARTMDFPDKIYARTKTSVIYAYCVRLPQGGLKLHIEDITDAVAQYDGEYPVMNIANQKLEASVLAYPDQYQWSYKRFKYPHDGVDIYTH